MYDSANMPRLFWFQHTTQVTIAATDKSKPGSEKERTHFFNILLTVHLSIFVSVINQLDAQNFCFTISFFHASTCFEHMEVEIVLDSLWYHHTYMCDDTRGCIIQFRPPDDEHMVLETCRGMKEIYCKTKILCIKLVNY